MTEVALEHRRSGEGEPLVAIHGIGSCWQVWNPVLPALEEHHDVLAISLPGYGKSAPWRARRPFPRWWIRRGGDGRRGLGHRAPGRQLDGRLDRRGARRPRAGPHRGGHLAGRDVDRQGAALLPRRAAPVLRHSAARGAPRRAHHRHRGGPAARLRDHVRAPRAARSRRRGSRAQGVRRLAELPAARWTGSSRGRRCRAGCTRSTARCESSGAPATCCFRCARRRAGRGT